MSGQWRVELEVGGDFDSVKFSFNELRLVAKELADFELAGVDEVTQTLTFALTTVAGDPNEALRTANRRWEESARLLGVAGSEIRKVRVVRVPPRAGLIARSRRRWWPLGSPALRSGSFLFVLTALALLIGTGTVVGGFLSEPENRGVPPVSPVASTQSPRPGPGDRSPPPTPPVADGRPNLVDNPSFEQVLRTGTPVGLFSWGEVRVRSVEDQSNSGVRRVELEVPAGQKAGVFLEVPASAGVAYVQRAYMNVERLAAGAWVGMGVEWQDHGANTIAAEGLKVVTSGAGFVPRTLRAIAPVGTSRARLTFTIVGGGQVVVDDVLFAADDPVRG